MDSSTLEIDDLLRFMVQQSASDLHLKPSRAPLLRIHGKLLPLRTPPMTPADVLRVLDGLLNERLRARLERDQAVDFGHDVAGLSRFRASVFQQRGTLSAVFRRVPFDFPGLEQWGLPAVLEEFTDLPQGLVLVTGPTGSGKSSTLAAMLRRIADRKLVHIVTIEDPIEFLLTDARASVTQREVGIDTPDFHTALRDALRQDPDVIMVGEMRDPTTIQTVLTAADTGHLVLSTLHTNGAAQTIDRIIDNFPTGHHRQVRLQLAATLQAVVSMKLVERADGSGMVAAVEILRRTPRVAKLIVDGDLPSLDEEIEGSVSFHKMQSMNQSLAALVVHGAIARESALAASVDPGALQLLLQKLAPLADEGPVREGGDPMAEPLSDYSKLVELQELRRLYEEQRDEHRRDLAQRDEEIASLRALVAAAPAEGPPGDDAEALRAENARLVRLMNQVREDYEAKLERLNARLRELSALGSPRGEPADGERRGFFRR